MSSYPSCEYHHLLKLLLIGNSGVGKSSILLRYSDNSFKEQFIYTIGVDFKVKTVVINGKVIKLQIWDTAGQERFRSFTTAYYRGANGIIMVYDITNRKSFESITNWLRDIERFANNREVAVLLIGNKCDASDSRCVPTEEAQRLADDLGIIFLECSAKSGTNIDSAFLLITTKIILSLPTTQSVELRYKSTVDITTTDTCAQRCCFT